MIRKVLGIIPARYESSRFPGKPLIRIGDKSMIQHVYERSLNAVDRLIVATDDDRIMEEVISFGGLGVMTRRSHSSGTDRCKEAVDLFQKESSERFDAVINIQGDEPFIHPEQIVQLRNIIFEYDAPIATLVKKITETEELMNSSIPKVVFTTDLRAIYFSRYPIPFLRNVENNASLDRHTYYKHIGMYAYQTQVLQEITKLKPGKLELAESLEQLRWIENRYSIRIGITEYDTISVDTPDDFQKVLSIYKSINPT